ncbi:MAG: hypothetical protein JRN15_08470, partial [Nitrososphaerota archaeon]|nr:hypothetical protein [Nitrososphaerota archaeon]
VQILVFVFGNMVVHYYYSEVVKQPDKNRPLGHFVSVRRNRLQESQYWESEFFWNLSKSEHVLHENKWAIISFYTSNDYV